MVIEAIGRVGTLKREYKVNSMILGFEELYHLKDSWSKDEQRKRLRRSVGRIKGKAGKYAVC